MRDIQSWILQYDVIEHPRDEINPPLVDEARVFDVDDAIPSQPVAPPVKETARPGGHGDKAQIENPCVENRGLVREPTVWFEWMK